MRDRRVRRALIALSSLAFASATVVAVAAPPWNIFATAPSVESDRTKEYVLTDQDGPWLILAGSFRGEGAREDALELLYELREQHSLPCHLHKLEFDFTGRQEGLGFDDEFGVDGRPVRGKQMRYLNESKFEEYAVMIGGFTSLQDPRLEATLTQVKHLQPECLKLEEGETTTKSYFNLRAIQDKLNLSAKVKGPLRTAMATRNPLLPEEYFTTRGVDPLIAEMNADVEYSLLENPANFTVKVATFKGKRAVSLEKDYAKLLEAQPTDALEQAALKAHELTMALRKEGVEAYEYHDYDQSIVTVGAFPDLGQPLPTGVTEINPDVHRVMETFKAEETNVTGAIRPKRLKGISFDIQPLPMACPKKSIAGSYLNMNR